VVIAEDPTVHARRLGKNSLVTFDDVDVSAIVEKEFEGKSVPLPVVLRACNKKSVEAIHAELRAAKGQSVRNEGDFVLSEHRMRRILMRIYFALPSWLRAFVLRSLTADPFRSKEQMGTVVITSLGSLARLPGWFIPRTLHPLCLAVGAVVKKPWVVDERVDVRDILHLTVLFDHDVVDGAPAARFLQRLAEQLQA
jgi:hypothetical protein